MKRQIVLLWSILAVIISMPGISLAKHGHGLKPDKIMYRLTEEQWVKTQQAQVRIGISASLNQAGLAQARKSLLANLNRIATADWHITRFDRMQDSSGLERLTVVAQARLPEAQLVNLRRQAKVVSKPGEAYTIESIDFTPSLAEINTARAQLRERLYRQVNAEIARLNSMYPQKHFSVHRINFTPYRMAHSRATTKQAMLLSVMPEVGSAMNVSSKVQITALVVLASRQKRGAPMRATAKAAL